MFVYLFYTLHVDIRSAPSVINTLVQFGLRNLSLTKEMWTSEKCINSPCKSIKLTISYEVG